MAKVALDGVSISSSVASNHITYRRYEYQYTTPTYNCGTEESPKICGGDAVYDWNYYSNGSATITGTVKGSVTNVKINGKSPIVKGDFTTENDSYSVNGTYVSGSHSNAKGSVSHGNGKNVFINGKSVAIKGSAVDTHAGTGANITEPSSANVNIGG